MVSERFHGSFTQQEAIDEDAIEAAVEVMKSGRLHRYNSAPGETSVVAKLEEDYAAFQDKRYCLACASGGYAIHIALRAAGLKPGEAVLTNAFTLAPAPGAIVNAGGRPALVEITEDLVIDLDDLEAKISGAGCAGGPRILLLSHMRGHLVDMERLGAIVDRHGLIMIEDCAHTMGAAWNGVKSGNVGLAGCFSTQTYKHINAGEGGLLTSDDPAFMARAIIMSGSYMLYERHGAAPDVSAFEKIRLETPNFSGRMDNLRAAILRPQLARLEERIERWNARYRAVEEALRQAPELRLPVRPKKERFVGSSIQFIAPGVSAEAAKAFVAASAERGVELKWFGAAEPAGFTSSHHHWTYVERQALPQTDAILAGLFDMRLPLTFTLEDCTLIGAIITDCANGTLREHHS